MPETIATYRVHKSGLWSSRHTWTSADGQVGVLRVERRPKGLIAGGRFQPDKGEVLVFRRDPGLLRGQFSMWTENREWLGSSLRWSWLRREINLHTGNKPFRLVPIEGFACGWSLQAPKTGEVARLYGNPVTGAARIDVFRKADFELLVFAYFLAAQTWREAIWPGPHADAEFEAPAASKARVS